MRRRLLRPSQRGLLEQFTGVEPHDFAEYLGDNRWLVGIDTYDDVPVFGGSYPSVGMKYPLFWGDVRNRREPLVYIPEEFGRLYPVIRPDGTFWTWYGDYQNSLGAAIESTPPGETLDLTAFGANFQYVPVVITDAAGSRGVAVRASGFEDAKINFFEWGTGNWLWQTSATVPDAFPSIEYLADLNALAVICEYSDVVHVLSVSDGSLLFTFPRVISPDIDAFNDNRFYWQTAWKNYLTRYARLRIGNTSEDQSALVYLQELTSSSETLPREKIQPGEPLPAEGVAHTDTAIYYTEDTESRAARPAITPTNLALHFLGKGWKTYENQVPAGDVYEINDGRTIAVGYSSQDTFPKWDVDRPNTSRKEEVDRISVLVEIRNESGSLTSWSREFDASNWVPQQANNPPTQAEVDAGLQQWANNIKQYAMSQGLSQQEVDSWSLNTISATLDLAPNYTVGHGGGPLNQSPTAWYGPSPGPIVNGVPGAHITPRLYDGDEDVLKLFSGRDPRISNSKIGQVNSVRVTGDKIVANYQTPSNFNKKFVGHLFLRQYNGGKTGDLDIDNWGKGSVAISGDYLQNFSDLNSFDETDHEKQIVFANSSHHYAFEAYLDENFEYDGGAARAGTGTFAPGIVFNYGTLPTEDGMGKEYFIGIPDYLWHKVIIYDFDYAGPGTARSRYWEGSWIEYNGNPGVIDYVNDFSHIAVPDFVGVPVNGKSSLTVLQLDNEASPGALTELFTLDFGQDHDPGDGILTSRYPYVNGTPGKNGLFVDRMSFEATYPSAQNSDRITKVERYDWAGNLVWSHNVPSNPFNWFVFCGSDPSNGKDWLLLQNLGDRTLHLYDEDGFVRSYAALSAQFYGDSAWVVGGEVYFTEYGSEIEDPDHPDFYTYSNQIKKL